MVVGCSMSFGHNRGCRYIVVGSLVEGTVSRNPGWSNLVVGTKIGDIDLGIDRNQNFAGILDNCCSSQTCLCLEVLSFSAH